MRIECPQCGFGREISEDRFPGNAVLATCPRCNHRFRFEVGAGLPQEDDPLPPGAIVSDVSPSAPAPAAARPAPAVEDPLEVQRKAAEAYAAHQAKAKNEQSDDEQPDTDEFVLDNPWENPQRDGHLVAFYQTCMRVMFAAPRFFAGLSPDSAQWRPLMFYLLVGVLQIVIERLWGEVLSSALAPSAATDPQLQKLLIMLSPETSIAMTVLLRSAMVTLELFMAAALYHLVLRLVVPDRANFSLTFQVLAYSAAPALLCIVPVAGSIAGFIWGIACSFVGCRYALRLSLAQTVMALVPLYMLGVPFIFYVLQSVQSVAG